MTMVVENLEIKKNPFSKGLFLIMTMLSLLTLGIVISQPGGRVYIPALGILLFGGGLFWSLRSNIKVWQDGFALQQPWGSREVLFREIRSLNFDSHYHGHGVHLQLAIEYGEPVRKLILQPSTFQKKPMERFFVILDEQCPQAAKNEHFINQATGKMNWKNKWRMY